MWVTMSWTISTGTLQSDNRHFINDITATVHSSLFVLVFFLDAAAAVVPAVLEVAVVGLRAQRRRGRMRSCRTRTRRSLGIWDACGRRDSAAAAAFATAVPIEGEGVVVAQLLLHAVGVGDDDAHDGEAAALSAGENDCKTIAHGQHA